MIFYFLENIILSNDKILLLKEFLILFNEMDLENEYIKEKKINFSIKKKVIEILDIILDYKEINNDIKKAYSFFLKAFLFCHDFDFGVIFL